MPIEKLRTRWNLIRIQLYGISVFIPSDVKRILHILVCLFQRKLLCAHVPGHDGVREMPDILLRKRFTLSTFHFLTSAALAFAVIWIAGFTAVLIFGKKCIWRHAAPPIPAEKFVNVGDLDAGLSAEVLKQSTALMRTVNGGLALNNA